MRRCFVVLVALLAAVASFVAPAASAEGTPIGNLGDTLRVEFKGIVADVTVHDVIAHRSPAGLPRDGFAAVDQRRRPVEGPGHRPHDPGAQPLRDGHRAFAFDGVTPYADAYTPKNTDAPDALQYAPAERTRRGRPSTAPCTGRCTAPS